MEEKEFGNLEVNKLREFVFSQKKFDYIEYYLDKSDFLSSVKEFNSINSGISYLDTDLIVKSILCENDKGLPDEEIILLIKDQKTMGFNLDYKKNTIMDFFLVDCKFRDFKSSHNYIAVGSFNTWIYLVQNNSESAHVFLIDTKKKKSHTIVNTNENNELIRNFAFTFFDTKILMLGGITKTNKLSNLIFSFDVSTYLFANERIKENKLTSRHKSGIITIFGYIYVIGGFKSIEEEETNVLNDINFIKIDTLMGSWMEFPVEGSKPKNMISPSIHFVQKRYVISISTHFEMNIHILDIMKKTGISLDLRVNFLRNCDMINRIYYYNGKFYLPEYKENNDESSLILYEINLTS